MERNKHFRFPELRVISHSIKKMSIQPIFDINDTSFHKFITHLEQKRVGIKQSTKEK